MLDTLRGRPLRIQVFAKWAVALVWMVIALYPIIWMFNAVFTQGGTAISINPRLLPSSLPAGIDNIQAALNENDIVRSYVVTTLFALTQIAGMLLVCSMAAFEFALYEFPLKRPLFFLALSALMVPLAVTLIPTYLIVVDLGWLNTLQGLAVPGMASAFGLFLLTQFMENMPRELLDAARIDGASHFGVYWRIAVPLSKNALITLAVLAFMMTWGNFIWPFVVSTRPEWYTVSVLVAGYNRHDSWVTIDTVMTVSLLAAIPPLVFYVVFQRFIVQGIAFTGMKG